MHAIWKMEGLGAAEWLCGLTRLLDQEERESGPVSKQLVAYNFSLFQQKTQLCYFSNDVKAGIAILHSMQV